MNKYIMIKGDPVDGFSYVGPFEDVEAALAYATDEACKENWWIVELDAPEVLTEDDLHGEPAEDEKEANGG